MENHYYYALAATLCACAHCVACVGRIGIIDHDTVELSNLQRQTLHTESRIGMPKAESAAWALKQFSYGGPRNITHMRRPLFFLPLSLVRAQ